MTDAERATALEAIAREVRSCTRCRLHETRTQAVPGEGSPDTEVMFVGEGPGFHEDRQGRPFVGRAGELLARHLASIGWRRDDVFITNVVKCRPPENRDPEPDEIAACLPYLRRQLETLDPALVVTLGRHSMGRFVPDGRISRDHGTLRPVDPSTGAEAALVYPMFHPAAALRSPDVARLSEEDIRGVPAALLEARRRRETVAERAAEREADEGSAAREEPVAEPAPGEPAETPAERVLVVAGGPAPPPAPASGAAPVGRAPEPARSDATAPPDARVTGETDDPDADARPADRDPSDQMTLF